MDLAAWRLKPVKSAPAKVAFSRQKWLKSAKTQEFPILCIETYSFLQENESQINSEAMIYAFSIFFY